ncbi:hypothetical protein BKA58DRAFT_187074 [Alternaria rosae]|uniref:uncharacterized protein n=1 Tax=Alternaria rosae TaxID=1187941 RepID=UPI001E8D49E1|nr:uncharacterized protein BKA58DRAFT_187074 [Alternaria rosae]KAH6868021.1 hypothetical protein BKA58DRAFT_187074 [Alternaria rosae]
MSSITFAYLSEKSGPSFTSTEKSVRDSAAASFKLFVGATVKAGIVTEPTSLSVSSLKASVVWYTTLKEDGDFLRLLGRGVEDAQLVLMLALLPNLEVLRIDGLSPFPLLDRYQFLSCSSTALQKLSALQINGSNTNSKEPVVKNSLQFLDITPNSMKIYLIAIAAGGHKFTTKALPSTKLEHVLFLGCGINVRLLRKIMLGQKLHSIAYRPGPAQVSEITGSEISVLDLLASFAHSKLSLKTLTLFSAGVNCGKTSLKIFENLETLGVPLGDVLDIPYDEVEPENIYARLKGQLPATLNHIILRYMNNNLQNKIVIEQLAVLKMQGMLPRLDQATFNFTTAVPTSYISAAVVNIGGPTAEVTACSSWDYLPKMETRIQEDFGKLYKDAGICMVVQQTDW